MNAHPNEVQLILDAINDVRTEIKDTRKDVSTMDKRINGRIRKLEQFRWQVAGALALGLVALNVALRFF